MNVWCRALGFPGGSASKESAHNAGDLGSIPGLGRSPGEGKGYPLQYSGLENSMDCIVHGVTKSWTQLSKFHLTFGDPCSACHRGLVASFCEQPQVPHPPRPSSWSLLTVIQLTYHLPHGPGSWECWEEFKRLQSWTQLSDWTTKINTWLFGVIKVTRYQPNQDPCEHKGEMYQQVWLVF